MAFVMLGHCGEEMEQKDIEDQRGGKKRHDAFTRKGLCSKRNVSPSLILNFSYGQNEHKEENKARGRNPSD